MRYIRNENNMVVSEGHCGISVMEDKAGSRKWRAFYDKLHPEGAKEHHTQMFNYFLDMLLLILVTVLNFTLVAGKIRMKNGNVRISLRLGKGWGRVGGEDTILYPFIFN